MKKGEFETFRSDWLLQVAADRGAKAALQCVVILGCKYLNRDKGAAWPSNSSLMAAIGATSETTIREALKLLVRRGHALVIWTKGGAKKTNIVVPLVDGKPLRNLWGSDAENPSENRGVPGAGNPSTFATGTPQLFDEKPLKKLGGNHLIEPPDEPLDGGGALRGAGRIGSTAGDYQYGLHDGGDLVSEAQGEDAPLRAPVGRSGAPQTAPEERSLTARTVEIRDGDDIDDFIHLHSHEFLITGSAENIRRLMLWIADIYGRAAMTSAAQAHRDQRLTISYILDLTMEDDRAAN